jgi:hypothetical protein
VPSQEQGERGVRQTQEVQMQDSQQYTLPLMCRNNQMIYNQRVPAQMPSCHEFTKE